METNQKTLIEKIDESLQDCNEDLCPAVYIEQALTAYRSFVEKGFSNTDIDTIMKIAQYKLLSDGFYVIKTHLLYIQETLENQENQN